MKRPTLPDTKLRVKQEPLDITDKIRARAYELYELRGRGDGHDLDDWLSAESQLTEEPQAKDS